MSLQKGREVPLFPVYSPQFHCLDSRFFLPGFHSGWAGSFCLCPLGGPLYYDQQVWPAVQVRDERYVQSLSSSRRHLPGLPGPYSAHGKVLWLYSYVVDIGAKPSEEDIAQRMLSSPLLLLCRERWRCVGWWFSPVCTCIDVGQHVFFVKEPMGCPEERWLLPAATC